MNRVTCAAAFLCPLLLAGVASGRESFRDGQREVEVERLAAPALDLKGRSLTPVRLHYPDGRRADGAVDGTAIVRLDASTREQAIAEVERLGGRLVRPLMPSIDLWLVEDLSSDGLALASRLGAATSRARGVVHASPNLYLATRRTADYTPTDPEFPGQWYFANLAMPEAWGLSVGDSSQTIVVIDTGCDLEHPDLAAKMDPGVDVVDDDDDPSYDETHSGAAHGTECAGLVAAATDNDIGIAGGCPECRLRCVRMLSDDLLPISANVAAYDFALEVDAAVVSNSWGFANSIPVPQSLADAIAEVAVNGRGGKGALVLFAAGNDDREIEDDELQAAPGVICVGAINNFDESTPFTNSGNAIDIVAPTGTFTTDISGPGGDQPDDYTTTFGGTSSACPVAAGVAGLLTSAAPEKTGAELSAILIASTKPAPFAVPDAQGHDPVYGYGIIDPPQALRVAMGISPPEGGGDQGGSGEGGGGGGSTSDASDDSGCGCALAGPSSNTAAAWSVLALVGALAARTRRRRR